MQVILIGAFTPGTNFLRLVEPAWSESGARGANLIAVRYADMGWPIRSGVTEAACKTLVKQHLCCAGMRWMERGAQLVLSLRELLQSETHWDQFWHKIEQFGVPKIIDY